MEEPSSFSIPTAAWQRRFDAPFSALRAGRPTPRALLKMIPMIVRLIALSRSRARAGFDPINMLNMPQPGPHQGVPLGGIGGGTVGRGWRGDFRRWQLQPGHYHHQPVRADQFSLFCQRDGQESQSVVLSAERPADGPLAAWAWKMDPACATYHALYPRAWTVYEEPLPGIRLTCRQLSPVIPHNYRESSFPAGELRWQIENTGPTAATVGFMFSWQNGTGTENDAAGGHMNRVFHLDGISGVELRHIHRQERKYGPGQEPAVREQCADPLTFAIAARAEPGIEVTYRSRFSTTGDSAEVWADFSRDGRLDNVEDERPTVPGETIGAALAVTLRLEAGEKRTVALALAWDMPLVRSGLGSRYYRRYTLFYGHQGDAAPAIARDVLASALDWEAQIAAWQQPILADPELPEWYKTALFNELYYIVDGGTLWAYPAEPGSDPVPEMGHFAYLEGHEYPMYNTYDVHFYASFALAALWPQLELALQRDIAAATLVEYPDTFQEVYSGKRAARKRRGAVPHDVGWPDEDPWRLVNGYYIHDVNDWKDLNSKFVLQVYRDYVATGDQAFVQDVWPAVEAAVERLSTSDRDGDGLIENDGFPDQTYDVWSVKGPSAYTGGLWLACLAAAAAMARLLHRPHLAERYQATLERGQTAYEAQLWNGRYYNYDSSNSRHHDSIMADQLAGQWYARACGLPSVVDPGRARQALQTILAYNVLRFQGGRMGAVNGMRPDGRVDRSSMQSQEVWGGTTYALAAEMIHEGMRQEAFQAARGVYEMTYAGPGYWFQTPEAWDEKGHYRSLAYMRPLAVWAMQWAIGQVPVDFG